MAQLDVNGLNIEYDTFGKAEADPVLLIMGLGMQMTSWSPEFCDALAAQGHYVIRFDNRDVGLSSKFHGARSPGRIGFLLNHLFNTPLQPAYTLDDMASDAAGVLEALGIDAAHVVGASMGGMIAQLMTVGHPHKVKTLTSLMSTSGDPALPRTRPDVAQHIFFRRPRGGDIEAAIGHMVKSMQLIASPAYPRSAAEWRELVVASVQRSFYPQGFGRQTAAIIADGSRVRRLMQIDRPTLVIHGGDDPLIPVEHGIDTARHVKGARLELIEGMGHDIPPPLVGRITGLISAHAHKHAANRAA